MNRVNAWIDTTVQDLRFALRSWTKAPTFAIAAIATLALGIGANTAIVSIASGVLVRPLPFIHPENLVQLYETQPRTQETMGFDGPVVYQDFEQWRTHSKRLDTAVTYVHGRKNLQGAGNADIEPVITVGAERGLFQMLGVAAFIGRTFDESDASRDVAVASFDFWKEHFNRDRSAVGRSVTIDGKPYTLIGVMPEGFQFPYRTSSTGLFDGFATTGLWIPWEIPADVREHPERRLESVVARVEPGATLESVRAELASMEGPSKGKRLVRVTPLQDVVSGPARESLLVLLGAVAMVLLVACVNVMNLYLARSASRGGEIALRAALGASRGRLIRQLLTESLLMALVAGGLGLLIGMWGSRVLIGLAGAQIPRAREIGIDWRVFTFLLATCVGTGFLFGTAPALIASRGGANAIKRGGAANALRNGLVVVEIALAFVLLAGAGLLLRTFLNLQQTSPGLNAENVLTAHVVAADANQALLIEQRVAQIPGVRAAGLISLLPLQNTGWTGGFSIKGQSGAMHQAELRFVTPGYFKAMGIPLHRGREFSPGDHKDAPRVMLVNQALVREYFAGQDAIGRETNRGTIIGIVGDVRQETLREPAKPEIYYTVAQNFAQLRTHGSTLVVRGDREPAPLTGAIRAAVREINPNQALFRVETMRGVVEASMADSHLYAWLVGVFAAMGLALAMTGIYGVIAYLVALRTREFGIRMALGAQSGGVLRLVIGHGLWLTAIGLVVGLALAVLVTRVLRGVLYGVAATDPVTFGAMAVVLALAALAAYLVPARRASRVDPSTALREG